MESHKKAAQKKVKNSEKTKTIAEIIKMGTNLFKLHRTRFVITRSEYSLFLQQAEASMKANSDYDINTAKDNLKGLLQFAYYQHALLNASYIEKAEHDLKTDKTKSKSEIELKKDKMLSSTDALIDSAKKYFALWAEEPKDKSSIALKEKYLEAKKSRDQTTEDLYNQALNAYEANKIDIAIAAAKRANAAYQENSEKKNDEALYMKIKDLLVKINIRDLFNTATKQLKEGRIHDAFITARDAYAKYPDDYLSRKHKLTDPHYQTFIKIQDLLIALRRAEVRKNKLNNSISSTEDTRNPAQRAYYSAVSAPVPRTPEPTRLTKSLTTKFGKRAKPSSSVGIPHQHHKKNPGRK